MEDRAGQCVGQSVENDAESEDQGEVFDHDDGREQIECVEQLLRPLPEGELRHEITQNQQSGQEEQGE